jgi:type I restriction enzyme, S subunit
MMAAEVKYKKTGNEWMPEIPEHWETIRIRNLFKEIDKRSIAGKEDLLSVSQYSGVTLRKDSFEDGKEITNAKTLKGYKIVEPNDLIVNIMLAWNGCLGISPYSGITSPAYCIYRVKDNQNLNPQYFGYLFTTSLFKGEFKKRSTGIIDSRLRLYSDEFFRIYCFVPPKDEQDKIVNLINSESTKITHFIQSRQRFIELLKEQRQSIITHAVTKGIDEEVKMKETGIDWMPEVPEHWEVRRLKYLVELYKHNKSVSEINSFDFKLALENIDNWTGKYIESVSPEFEGEGRYFKEGDVLFGKLRPYLAKAFLPDRNGICVSEILVFTPNSELITSEFLFQRILTKGFIDIVDGSTYGAKMPRAGWDFIGNMRIAYPPTLKEQRKIVKHIKAETRTLDIAISKAEREIELIKEYREAMIAEAVKGKIKI